MTEGECIPHTIEATMVVVGPGGAVWKGREESKKKNSFPPPGFPRQLKRNERQERERGEEGRNRGGGGRDPSFISGKGEKPQQFYCTIL